MCDYARTYTHTQAEATHSFTHLFTRLTLQVMNIRIVTCVLLGIAILFTIIGVATNQWNGGNLLRNSGNYAVTANAVGYLLIVGAVLLCIALIIGIVQLQRSTESFCLCVAYFVTLYLGVAALLVAVIVYTEVLARQWSYFIAVVGCVFALQVAILVPTYTRCTVKQTTTRRTVRVTH